MAGAVWNFLFDHRMCQYLLRLVCIGAFPVWTGFHGMRPDRRFHRQRNRFACVMEENRRRELKKRSVMTGTKTNIARENIPWLLTPPSELGTKSSGAGTSRIITLQLKPNLIRLKRFFQLEMLIERRINIVGVGNRKPIKKGMKQ